MPSCIRAPPEAQIKITVNPFLVAYSIKRVIFLQQLNPYYLHEMKVHNPKATGIPSIKPVPFEQHLVNRSLLSFF
jgi:hypothetical protein